jgi:hypothetical protein
LRFDAFGHFENGSCWEQPLSRRLRLLLDAGLDDTMAKAMFVKMMCSVIDLTYLLLETCATAGLQDMNPAVVVVSGGIPHIYAQAAVNKAQLSHTSVICYGSCVAPWWPVSRQTRSKVGGLNPSQPPKTSFSFRCPLVSFSANNAPKRPSISCKRYLP